MTYNSTLNADLRDAAACAAAAVDERKTDPRWESHRAYWHVQSHEYTLVTVGSNPCGFDYRH